MIQAVTVIGILLAIVLLVLLVTYNGLTDLRQDVRVCWAKMDEQLKRRYELIPVLTAAVESAGGEPATKLAAVSAAKNQAAVAFNPTQLATAEAALTAAIRDLLKVAEQDAGLNSNPRFAEVRQKLIAREKAIQKARRRYNAHVENLNESIRSFPMVVTAKLIGLKPQTAFESTV